MKPLSLIASICTGFMTVAIHAMEECNFHQIPLSNNFPTPEFLITKIENHSPHFLSLAYRNENIYNIVPYSKKHNLLISIPVKESYKEEFFKTYVSDESYIINNNFLYLIPVNFEIAVKQGSNSNYAFEVLATTCWQNHTETNWHTRTHCRELKKLPIKMISEITLIINQDGTLKSSSDFPKLIFHFESKRPAELHWETSVPKKQRIE